MKQHANIKPAAAKPAAAAAAAAAVESAAAAKAYGSHCANAEAQRAQLCQARVKRALPVRQFTIGRLTIKVGSGIRFDGSAIPGETRQRHNVCATCGARKPLSHAPLCASCRDAYENACDYDYRANPSKYIH